MPTTVTVHDRTTAGTETGELTLEFLVERVSVRELIRARVYQEVTEYNARQPTRYRGLVAPSETELALNGSAPEQPPKLDWERHYQRALAAFSRSSFLLLVDDRQLTDLDAEVELRPETEIVFLKLVPLIGG